MEFAGSTETPADQSRRKRWLKQLMQFHYIMLIIKDLKD
jgi:hypothetical protein